MFDKVCGNDWNAAVGQDAKKNGDRFDEFLKCKSQALAEQASGDVYFLIPNGFTAKRGSAVSSVFRIVLQGRDTDRVQWVGWEYPALQRNTNVQNVWQVDPNDSQNSARTNIWTKGATINTPDPLCK